MPPLARAFVVLLAAPVALAGCATSSTGNGPGDREITNLLMTEQDVSGWTITPDDGPVDGKTDDCTGAPYDWPDLQTLNHASQFLDRPDETVALVVKRVDGQASASIEALRGALAPCAPQSSAVPNGAMITLVGDDSFAYQSKSSDDLGEFTFSNMLVSCEDLILEVSLLSYSSELDQAGLEELVSPSIERLTEAGGF